MLLYLPAPHDVHLALPFESDDLPVSQSVQLVDLEISLILPTGHLWHSSSPVSLPNSPGKHGRHPACPGLFW